MRLASFFMESANSRMVVCEQKRWENFSAALRRSSMLRCFDMTTSSCGKREDVKNFLLHQKRSHALLKGGWYWRGVALTGGILTLVGIYAKTLSKSFQKSTSTKILLCLNVNGAAKSKPLARELLVPTHKIGLFIIDASNQNTCEYG